MTSLAHSTPAIAIPAVHRPRSTPVAAGHLMTTLAPVLGACVVVLALATLFVAGIDTGGRLPHPQPLPAPSAPFSSGS